MYICSNFILIIHQTIFKTSIDNESLLK